MPSLYYASLRHTFSGFLASLLVLSSAIPVKADRVELDNGDRWSGRLVRMDRQTAWFEIDPGGSGQPQRIAVARDRLLALNVTDPVTARLLSGERIIGTLGSVTSEGVSVESAGLGPVVLSWEKVAELQGGGAPVAEQEGTAPLAGLPERALLDERELSAIHGAGKPAGTGASTEAAVSETEVATKMKEEDIRQIFLRESAVLLRPGQWESDVSFRYTRLPNASVEGYVGGGIISSERRIFESQISFRTSPVKDVEVFASIPALYGSQKVERVEQRIVKITDPATGQSFETVRAQNIKQKGSRWGVGDVTAGVKYHVFHEGPSTPDVIFSVTGTAPTGSNPYDFSPAGVTFGSGHWGAGAGLTAIKSFDPAVVFVGVDYSYRFPGDHLGGTVRPGGVIGYNIGTGFALNDKLSLSGQLSGAVQAGSASAPDGIDLSQREQLALRLAFTYQATPNCYLEPSLSMGLTDDSPDSVVGLSVSNRF